MVCHFTVKVFRLQNDLLEDIDYRRVSFPVFNKGYLSEYHGPFRPIYVILGITTYQNEFFCIGNLTSFNFQLYEDVASTLIVKIELELK